MEALLGLSKSGLNNLDQVASETQDAEVINKGGSEEKIVLAQLRQHERTALKAAKLKAETTLRILDAADSNEYYQDRRLRELDLLRPLEEDEIVP